MNEKLAESIKKLCMERLNKHIGQTTTEELRGIIRETLESLYKREIKVIEVKPGNDHEVIITYEVRDIIG